MFRYAIATGRAERDLTADQNRAAITEPKRIGELLRAIDTYQGQPTVMAALELAPLVFVRPGELRGAEWAEIDLEAAEGRIAAERNKMREVHVVPLSKQAVAILEELHTLTGRGRRVFPGLTSRERPISGDYAPFGAPAPGLRSQRNVAARVPSACVDALKRARIQHGRHRAAARARRAKQGPRRVQPRRKAHGASNYDAGLGGLPRRTEGRRQSQGAGDPWLKDVIAVCQSAASMDGFAAVARDWGTRLTGARRRSPAVSRTPSLGRSRDGVFEPKLLSASA